MRRRKLLFSLVVALRTGRAHDRPHLRADRSTVSAPPELQPAVQASAQAADTVEECRFCSSAGPGGINFGSVSRDCGGETSCRARGCWVSCGTPTLPLGGRRFTNNIAAEFTVPGSPSRDTQGRHSATRGYPHAKVTCREKGTSAGLANCG